MHHHEDIRKSVLTSISDNDRLIQSLFQYCENVFKPWNHEGEIHFPMDDEGHVVDWRDYIEESRTFDHPLAFLQSRIGQLNFPVKEGISKSDAYADVALRGKPFDPDTHGDRLTLNEPENLTLFIKEHPSGALPVLMTTERKDFETLFRAIGCKSEPVPVQSSVNAQSIAGFNNWDRVNRYKEKWLSAQPPGSGTGSWPNELQRVAKEEPWRFRDRLILIFQNVYSGITAKELGLDMDDREWFDRSRTLRVEHEFTHYTTKRLFNQMHNNLLDETLADFMGITASLGGYKASWYLTFLGLEKWPDVRKNGRIFTYLADLSEDALPLLGELMVRAAYGMEKIYTHHYDSENRPAFLLTLACMTLELIASDEGLTIFEENYRHFIKHHRFA